MRIVYIDILLFLNLYVTYFLIAGTCCFTHRHAGVLRRLTGSLAGALSSLVILLPPLPVIVNLLIKLAISSLIVLLSMGYGGIKAFVKNSAAFFVINCVYAGIMLALWLFFAPTGMIYNNGISYFELPIIVIILATVGAYIILRAIRRVLDAKTLLDKKYIIEITTEKGTAELKGIPDSGNKLTDFFSGLPIIFCGAEKCLKICPDSIINILSGNNPASVDMKGIRIVPCHTVSGDGIVLCFKPQKLVIKSDDGEKETNALIGFTKNGLNGGEFDAVFNPNIL